MSHSDCTEPSSGALGLDAGAIEILAARVAELLADQLPARPSINERAPKQLLSAAEVSEWWGVSRGWVYQHAGELAAIRIGDGERPRLRFDPDKVAQHLDQPPTIPPERPSQPKVRARRSPRMRGDCRPLAFRADPELSSASNQEMAGRRTNAPGRGAEDEGFGAMTSLPSRTPAGGGCSTSRRIPGLHRHDHRR
jgi:hypothetical protein